LERRQKTVVHAEKDRQDNRYLSDGNVESGTGFTAQVR